MLVSDHIRDRLLEMIADYRQRVDACVAALKTKYGEDDLLAAWLGGRIQQKGMIDDEHESRIYFHGCGCCVTSTEAEVDFDFGPNGRHDGFDAWRLGIFAKSQPTKWPEFQDEKVIERALEELMHTNIIYSPRWKPSAQLLYFKDLKN